MANIGNDPNLNLAAATTARAEVEPTTRQRFLYFDSFYRADSATDLGNGETNGAAYTMGQASGTTVWGINGNQAYVVSGTVGRAVAVQQANEADVIVEADVNNVAATNGLAFRYTDINNFWLVVLAPTFLQLTKYVAGTATTVTTVNKTYGKGRLSVLAKGNKIEVYVDGFLQTRQYDSFNATATMHGMYTRAETNTYRWSNLSIRPLGQVPLSIKEGFESTLPWYWSAESPGQSYSQTFSTSIKKSGNQSFRVELRNTDPDANGSKRCEIALPAEGPLEEHWYGCSIFLPKGGDEDYHDDAEPEILLQWHGTPDATEANVSPPLALLTKNGYWRIEQYTDPKRLSTQNTLTMTAQDLEPYWGDKGKWTDWVFHVRWGYSTAHNPITEVYKNGILVYENNGNPNCYNDGTGIFAKLGVYKWPWKNVGNISSISRRVVYYDDYFAR